MKKYIMIGILFAFPFCLSADEPVKAIYVKITKPDNAGRLALRTRKFTCRY